MPITTTEVMRLERTFIFQFSFLSLFLLSVHHQLVVSSPVPQHQQQQQSSGQSSLLVSSDNNDSLDNTANFLQSSETDPNPSTDHQHQHRYVLGQHLNGHDHHRQQQQQQQPSDLQMTSSSSSSSSQEDDYAAAWRAQVRKRDKDLRLNAIKNYVMQKLGIAPKISSRPSSPERPNFLEQLSPSSIFSGQLQTLYASCEIPPNVDKDIWTTPEFFHIYFNIPPSVFAQAGQTTVIMTSSPPTTLSDDSSSSSSSNERSFQAMMRASAQLSRNGQRNNLNFGNGNGGGADPIVVGNSIHRRRVSQDNSRRGGRNSNIISAKLKLYKIGRGQVEPATGTDTKDQVTSTASPCNETTTDGVTLVDAPQQQQVIVNALGNFPSGQMTTTVDEKIRVSVYWYILPVKKHHFKKKLLDTKMLSVKESKWVEFDIQRAAIAWQQRQENFGLVLQVENEDNDWVNPRKYFTGLPCPAPPTVVVVEQGASQSPPTGNDSSSAASTDGTGNETKISPSEVLSVLPPPVLEICTLSVPAVATATSSQSSSTTTTTPMRQPSTIFMEAVKQQQQQVELKNYHHRNHRNGHQHRHRHGENHRPYRNNQRHLNQTEQQQLQQQGATGSGTNEDVLSSTFTNQIIKKDQQQSDRFQLDEDHPLRDILATVATSSSSSSVTSNSSSLTSSHQNQNHNFGRLDPDLNDSDYNVNDNEDDDDVIIQKIYISPPVPSHHHHQNQNQRHRSSSSRANSNFNR